MDLNYFFNQWYSGEGYPSFNIQWSQDANNRATITIDQTTSVPSSVSFFQVPLVLSFKNASQEKTITVQNNVKNQVVTADIGFKADTVLIDPDLYLISRNNKSVHTKSIEPETESVTISPNPFTNKININFKKADGKKILVQLYDNFGHFIVDHNFTGSSSDQTYTITAPNMAAGTYLLRITFNGKVTTRYMVKSTK
jgi:hypothetical protein